MTLTVSYHSLVTFFSLSCQRVSLTCLVILQSTLAQHRSIAWARARNDELQAEINAAKTALTTAQEGKQAAKAAFAATQKSEYDTKFVLASSQESEQAIKIALAALQA